MHKVHPNSMKTPQISTETRGDGVEGKF